MDIIPNKKSDLLYQKGNRKITGVVDLRRFADKKEIKKIEIKNKTVLEIAPKKKVEIIKTENKNHFKKIQKKTVIKRTKADTRIFKQKNKRFNFHFKSSLLFQKSFACFLFVSIFLSLTIFTMSSLQKEYERKERVLGASTQAYGNLKAAGQFATSQSFDESANSFNSATLNFIDLKKMIDEFGFGVVGIINSLPVNTPLSTAKNLAEAGENISAAGENITALLDKISQLDQNNFSLSSVLKFQTDFDKIAFNLKNSQKNIAAVNLDYIPKNVRSELMMAQNQLPIIADNFENLANDFPIITKMLGSDRPQKYLLLFENNSEIRAGGGFIGSYGIIDIENGKIKNLFIDGIFNPDGQLNEKIIPPQPLQKVSAAWSMHDANWFADFPTSAKKVALFYEKTGGPTVDGVIAITPNVTEKMLGITGPIKMEEYGITVDENNFLMKTQLQVEELYNRQENKPKKFLADLAPQIIQKLLDTENLNAREKIEKYFQIADLMEESLREKHIIIYHRDTAIENMIIRRGWGGQVLNSGGDYLSVINSNINGYKTDAVVDEQIIHSVEILSDGSVIDTLKIIREHTGGKNEYDWYNRVNSNYLRVFVPLGSVLLEAKGHTWQDYEPPADYSDFKTDPDVAKIESTLKIDSETGTHIFEEAGKTVFGNWVYVSPGETVEVVYKYQLPYKINFNGFTKPADKYSILIQKQLGSAGSKFSGSIQLPSKWDIIWNSSGLNFQNQNESKIETNLNIDRIYGVAFEREIEE